MAALFVAIFHTWQWSNPVFNDTLSWLPFIARGDKAVPIFVTLSGLLIHRSLARVQAIDSLRTYISRRFLRLFPVYFATVVVSLVFLGPFQINLPKIQYALIETFMLRSFGFPGFINPQAWSLYVEVLFYATAPIFVVASYKRPVLWALLALAVFSLGDAVGPRELGLWKYFLFGCIASQAIARITLGQVSAAVMVVAGLAIIAYDISGGHDWIAKSIMRLSGGGVVIRGGHPAYTLTLGLGVVMVTVGAVQSSLFCRLLEVTPLRALGSISYSLFMWHSFMIVINFPITFNGLGAPVTIAPLPPAMPTWYLLAVVVPALLMVSSISYLLLERPFLLMRRRNGGVGHIAGVGADQISLPAHANAPPPLRIDH